MYKNPPATKGITLIAIDGQFFSQGIYVLPNLPAAQSCPESQKRPVLRRLPNRQTPVLNLMMTGYELLCP